MRSHTATNCIGYMASARRIRLFTCDDRRYTRTVFAPARTIRGELGQPGTREEIGRFASRGLSKDASCWSAARPRRSRKYACAAACYNLAYYDELHPASPTSRSRSKRSAKAAEPVAIDWPRDE